MNGSKAVPRPKGIKFLLLVIVAFAVLAFWESALAAAALEKSLDILRVLLPVFVIVILLMGVIGYLSQGRANPERLARLRGVRGWFWALLIGLLSHGPMYAWYPLLENLRARGLRDGYIATFFYARAVKLPLLPLMVDYFGLAFTVVLTLYIIIGSLVQGWLVEILQQRRG